LLFVGTVAKSLDKPEYLEEDGYVVGAKIKNKLFKQRIFRWNQTNISVIRYNLWWM